MKSGAVLERNSLSAPVIDCDDHDRASSAAPQPRHHFQSHPKKHYKYQIDNQIRGMTHNHPSGDPTPSAADIRITRDIVSIAQPFGIAVHDHLIVGRNGHASFKGLKLI